MCDKERRVMHSEMFVPLLCRTVIYLFVAHLFAWTILVSFDFSHQHAVSAHMPGAECLSIQMFWECHAIIDKNLDTVVCVKSQGGKPGTDDHTVLKATVTPLSHSNIQLNSNRILLCLSACFI